MENQDKTWEYLVKENLKQARKIKRLETKNRSLCWRIQDLSVDIHEATGGNDDDLKRIISERELQIEFLRKRLKVIDDMNCSLRSLVNQAIFHPEERSNIKLIANSYQVLHVN